MRGGGRPRPGTGEPAIDLRSSWSNRPVAAPSAQPEPDPDPDREPDPDTLLVPVDAWNRMLTQLGNLHEAGRDLADARERAARAETEAEFLRDRVHDLRDRLAAAEAPPSTAPETDTTAAGPAASLVRSTYTRWRARRRPRR